MPLSRFEDLLRVRWYDGLVVGSRHLTHADQRVAGLLAEICQAGLDQPGLLTGGSATGTPSQLIEIEAGAPAGEVPSVQVALTRSFFAAAPSGKIVLGYGGRSSRGTADHPVRVTLPAQPGQESVLVCVRQESDENRSVTADNDQTLDLVKPVLAGVAIARSDYKERLVTDYADYVPIGSMSLSTGSPVVDQGFIAPVLKLAAVRAFDDGIVPKISAHWETLLHAVAELIDAAGVAFAAGKVGADLMSRRTDYEALRTVLLCTWGIAKNIEQTSPTRLLFEAIQPITTWWDFHRTRHFANVNLDNEQSPVAAVTRRAQALAGLTHRDLCSGSNDLLTNTHEFLAGLSNVLAVG